MKKFSAQVSEYVRQSEEKMERILKNSIQDVLVAAQTDQVALARGATFVEQGKIPRDTGFLMNSLASGLNGLVSAKGEMSYVLTISGMKIGDTAFFTWTAPYARKIEFGFDSYPGAHYVGFNAARWPNFVSENAKREA